MRKGIFAVLAIVLLIGTFLQPLPVLANGATQKLIGVASGDYFALAQFTAEASGDITELGVRCASSGSIKLAIYPDNSSEPGDLLSNAFTDSTPVIAGWNTIPFSNPIPVTAGQKLRWQHPLLESPARFSLPL